MCAAYYLNNAEEAGKSSLLHLIGGVESFWIEPLARNERRYELL